jgi:hypothetical protein
MTSSDKCSVCKKMAYLECNTCNHKICVKHRYYTDHKCYSKKQEKIQLIKLIDSKNYTKM